MSASPITILSTLFKRNFSELVLHVVAVITTLLVFVLIFSGGLVTSKGVGMSVPDWPTTYGYNMFLFPISRWVGGVFYEHTHRLLASGIGLMTLLLGLLTFLLEQRRWVRRLALIAIVAVVGQGVLGGLRVTLYKDELGIFHAILAQSFFALLIIFSAVTSSSFLRGDWFCKSFTQEDFSKKISSLENEENNHEITVEETNNTLEIQKNRSTYKASSLRWLALLGVLLIYFQLIVAATMRHQHAGLSIPDFPTAYGHFLPDLSKASIDAINSTRLSHAIKPTTSFQICLQMFHRAGAVLLFGIVLLLMIRSRELLPTKHWAHRWSFLWCLLLFFQIALGAWTIWSNKAADIATVHMALGALMLGGSILFTFRLFCSHHVAPNSAELSYSDGN